LKKALVIADYGLKEGYGHISRVTSLLDSMFFQGYEFFFVIESNEGARFLSDKTINILEVIPNKLTEFDSIIIDTYNEKRILEINEKKLNSKVIQITDSSVSPNYFIKEARKIDLEVHSPRSSDGKYIFGSLLVSHKLINLKERRKQVKAPVKNKEQKNIVVNLGGSLKAKRLLLESMKQLTKIQNLIVSLFCNEQMIDVLKDSLDENNPNQIHFYGYGDQKLYFERLLEADILICSAGVSFLEGLYLGVPIIVYDFPSNAHENWVKFRKNQNVIGRLNCSSLTEESCLRKILESKKKQRGIDPNSQLIEISVEAINDFLRLTK